MVSTMNDPQRHPAGAHPSPAAADPTPYWTRAACLAFAFATLYALAVVALRLPAWQADHREAFRIALLLHVNLAVFVWLALTMAGQWARSLGERAWRWPLAAGIAGTVLLAASPLAGGRPVMADYFPWLQGNPLFALGLGLVCAGTLGMAVQRLALASGPGHAALRLAAWPPIFAAAAAATTLLAGGSGVDVAWAAGHTLLFAHVAMLCHEWTVHGNGDAARATRAVRVLVAASALLAVLPLAFAPGSPGFRFAYTASMMAILWLPPVYVALGLRRNPARVAGVATRPVSRLALALSMPLFALGAALGVAIALAGTPTTLITAHYHAAMGAVAISRMGMAYLHTGALALDTARWPALRRQLAVYASALVLLTAGLAIAAVEGAPRKTSATEFVAKGAWYRAGMSVAGVGGTLALVGTVWLLFNLLGNDRRARKALSRPTVARSAA
jgi:hypothetical protein